MITSFKEDKYAFLSNFYPCVISDTISYKSKDKIYFFNWPSAEHYYQSLKTNIVEEKEKILKCETSGIAKRVGKKLTIREDWEIIKLDMMLLVIFEKFKQNPELKNMLIKTSPHKLVEGNYWHDNYWGSCSCNMCIFEDKYNHLGKILETVRDSFIPKEK
jgi:hypothetical protein